MMKKEEFIQLFKDNSLPAKNMRVENPLMKQFIDNIERKNKEDRWKEFIKELEKYVLGSTVRDSSKRDCIDSIYPTDLKHNKE